MNFLAVRGKGDPNAETGEYSKALELLYGIAYTIKMSYIGSYDDEPATVSAMDSFADENGYAVDISDTRYHHEIYLIDPRKTEPAKLKTVIRHPVKKL